MNEKPTETQADAANASRSTTDRRHPVFDVDMPDEYQGPKGPEPTRYGDWEVKGRCSDF